MFEYIRITLPQKVYISVVVTLVFVLGFDASLYAQSRKKEYKEYPVSKIDRANKTILSNPTESFELASEALLESKKRRDIRAEASAYNTLGTLYFNTGEFDKAISYFTKAEAIYKKIKDPKNEEYTLKYLAKSHEALNEAETSIGYNNQAERKSISPKKQSEYRVTNSKIKRKQGRKSEAITDLENELKSNKELDKNQKVDIYLELGSLYIEDKKTSEGVDLINKAIDASKEVTSDSLEVKTLNYAWDVYEKNNLQEQNVVTQKEAITKSLATNKVSVSSAANFNLGNSYIDENPKLAADYFEKSAELTKKEPQKIDHIKAVERLSEAYEKSGEYAKALSKYKEYVNLVDSIKESEVASKLKNALLSSKYRLQESKIKQLELKQEQKESALRTQQSTIFGLGLGLGLFALSTYFLVKNIRQKQRSNTLIQLASLRSQMNPHFIFNSLNSVNGFISKNEEIKANRYISDFSKLMRTVLNNSNNPSITLTEELSSLEIYLALEHSRFEDKFDYEISIDPELNTDDIDLPPMLIQPYIENAVWHGLRYKESKGFLQLHLEKKHNLLQINITDNGIGRAASQKLKTNHQRDYKSTGIANTKERMKLLNKFNGLNHKFSNKTKIQYEVEIIDLQENNEATGTKVQMKIPLMHSTND